MTTNDTHSLDGGYPIAPRCEQYLNIATLGTGEDRSQLIEVVADVFRYHPGPNHTTTPRTYARRFVNPMDAVTVNVLNTSWQRKLITNDDISKMKAQALTPLSARNFALLLMGITDLPKLAGTMRQFIGLHYVDLSGDTMQVRSIDLSTDDLYARYQALFRFSIDVSERWRNASIFVRRFSEDMALPPDMYDLLWDHPEHVDLIAQLVVERKAADYDMLREAASGAIPASLSDGLL